MLDTLPDSLILAILNYLPPNDVGRVGQCSQSLRSVCQDDLLWRTLFHRHFRVSPYFQEPIAYDSWRSEFIRLVDETPIVEAEILTKHTDQVLHVSFSHDGRRFATTAKDGLVNVWNSSHPVILEYSYSMKTFSWKYTQFSEFNESDTLLLVSGVLFGLQSTSGEIVVFSLTGGFQLCCRVVNKPYDVFGSWYSDTYLFSGDLHWLGQMVSKSVIWLNKASQETESEHAAVMNQVFRFWNPKASSVRSLLVANCIEPLSLEDESLNQPCSSQSLRSKPAPEPHSAQCDRVGNPPSHAVRSPMEQDLRCINSRGVRGTLQGAFQNWKPLDNVADIDYSQEFHRTREAQRDKVSRDGGSDADNKCGEQEPGCSRMAMEEPEVMDEQSPANMNVNGEDFVLNQEMFEFEPYSEGEESEPDDSRCTKLNKFYAGLSEDSSNGSRSSPEEFRNEGPCRTKPSELEAEDVIDPRDKWLIFTCGSETYTPHQIGFKKIKPFKFKGRLDPGPSLRERLVEQKRRKELERNGVPDEEPVDYSDFASVSDRFDGIDSVLDLHGHIIGMTLSPDHRYLYVNSRPWPTGYIISDPLHPPPIAQEIDIHVIDLVTLRQVGMMRRAHRAYTPNEECFFIFLDASDYYLASGAEDKHGYLWDRHYGISLCKLPHTDVVNSVAFNPTDSQMLVSVSDDHTIKVWRSKRECRGLGMSPENLPQGTKLYTKVRPPTRQSHSI